MRCICGAQASLNAEGVLVCSLPGCSVYWRHNAIAETRRFMRESGRWRRSIGAREQRHLDLMKKQKADKLARIEAKKVRKQAELVARAKRST